MNIFITLILYAVGIMAVSVPPGTTQSIDTSTGEILTRCRNLRWIEDTRPGNPTLAAECVSEDGMLDATRKIPLNKCYRNRNGILGAAANGNAFWSCDNCSVSPYNPKSLEISPALYGIPFACDCKKGASAVQSTATLITPAVITTNKDGDLCCYGWCSGDSL